jgi:hypothetical protein
LLMKFVTLCGKRIFGNSSKLVKSELKHNEVKVKY